MSNNHHRSPSWREPQAKAAAYFNNRVGPSTPDPAVLEYLLLSTAQLCCRGFRAQSVGGKRTHAVFRLWIRPAPALPVAWSPVSRYSNGTSVGSGQSWMSPQRASINFRSTCARRAIGDGLETFSDDTNSPCSIATSPPHGHGIVHLRIDAKRSSFSSGGI